MTTSAIKMFSGIPVRTFPSARGSVYIISFPGTMRARVFFRRMGSVYSGDRRRIFVRVLIMLFFVGILLSLGFMMSTVIRGGRLPERERVLSLLEEERRVQYALVSRARSPHVVTEEALEGLHMVMVSDIRYLQAREAVATVTQVHP